MNIQIKALEIKVGDVFKNRMVVRVMPPRRPGWTLMVSYNNGPDQAFYPDEDLLVNRTMTIIENEPVTP